MGGWPWRKAKLALGLHLCVHSPRTVDHSSSLSDDPETPSSSSSAAAVVESPASGAADSSAAMPDTPTSASSGLLSKSGSNSFKTICAICLGTMKPGLGHALFTAECSHTFHFHCITSNVKHGNLVCPVCRAKWKEIPFQGPPASELPLGRARINPVHWAQDDGYMTVLSRLPRADSTTNGNYNLPPLFHASEPRTFDDDEPLDSPTESASNSQPICLSTVDIKTYPEFSAVPQSASVENFTVLVHLKAPLASRNASGGNVGSAVANLQTSRTPVDLVTVLDVSGSMAGTKLALLKRAMGFVIQNLRPSDRLSVVAFSSTARRIFHLRRMTESGVQQALQAVNSLNSSGGTNIAEGLHKAAKIFENRKMRNPVCSIILLSDGHDTYTTVSASEGSNISGLGYSSLVPPSITGEGSGGPKIPVHTFGFGADHDSALMHSISETSGGTFSFIEAEGVIQDAFAQCIGGLLSVVAQELHLGLECLEPGVRLTQIKSGSYSSRVEDDGRKGSIDVGGLYADEERDFLLSVNVPQAYQDSSSLLEISCSYRYPVSMEAIKAEGWEVRIRRPKFVTEQPTLSIEVDRQRNRLYTAEAIAEARAAAERGALTEAVAAIEECRKKLSESLAGQSGDRLCAALDAELKEMQERMASRQRYEASGRAYVLSGLSSHSWQRATARGDSTDSGSLVHAYQTPSMVEMLQRSQTLLSPAASRPNPTIQPSRSFPARPPKSPR